MLVWEIGLNPNLIYILNELLVKFENQRCWFNWQKDFLKMQNWVQIFGKFFGSVLGWIFLDDLLESYLSGNFFVLNLRKYEHMKIKFIPRSDRENLLKIKKLGHIQNNSILEQQLRLLFIVFLINLGWLNCSENFIMVTYGCCRNFATGIIWFGVRVN